MASHNPEPGLVADLRSLLSKRTSRREIVDMIASREMTHEELDAAHSYVVGQMPRFAWDDHTGTHMLMILEDVMRETRHGA